MLDDIYGALACCAVGAILAWFVADISYANKAAIENTANELIIKCEANLPRTQHCKIIAVPAQPKQGESNE